MKMNNIYLFNNFLNTISDGLAFNTLSLHNHTNPILIFNWREPNYQNKKNKIKKYLICSKYYNNIVLIELTWYIIDMYIKYFIMSFKILDYTYFSKKYYLIG